VSAFFHSRGNRHTDSTRSIEIDLGHISSQCVSGAERSRLERHKLSKSVCAAMTRPWEDTIKAPAPLSWRGHVPQKFRQQEHEGNNTNLQGLGAGNFYHWNVISSYQCLLVIAAMWFSWICLNREFKCFLSAYWVITRSSADADKPARRVYRSVKVTKHSTIPYVRYSFLLCNSNFVFVFTTFDFKKCCDLKIGVRGHSRSLKVAPFDRFCMISY